MVVQGLCVLVHLFCIVVAEDPPAVMVTPLEWTPISFRSQVAKFGDQFRDDNVSQPLLMLPPDESSLCIFPTSLENMTIEEAEYLTMGRPIALLVASGDCPDDQKALVIAMMKHRLTPSLRYMIVYNTNSSQPNDLTFMSSNSTLQGLDGVGAMFLSWNSGVLMLEKVSNYSRQSGWSSNFLSETSRAWDLRVNLQVVHTEDYSEHSSSEPEPNGMGDFFHYLRSVMITLLVASPFIRAGYLWYSAGGRILVRRDENGRVNGLQYIHPLPHLIATGLGMHHEDHAATVLTEEQVQALPKLVYKRKPMGGDDTQSESDDEAEGGTIRTKISSSSMIGPADATDAHDDKTMEIMEQAPENEFTGGLVDSETVHAPSGPELFTTCTMCSICIDEFEDGETIQILPKCNHGFHFDCIKPWLTERQSCCPLCKTDVLTPDTLHPASSECQDSPV
jgi:Ring finger domain